MSEPSKRAMERATIMVARWEHGSAEHRKWLRDMCIPEVALALDAAWREAIEEALTILNDEGWLGQSHKRIRALADRDPP